MKLSHLFLTAVWLLISAAAFAAQEQRPNVLIVLIDDAGMGDLGCHGHPFLKTPNLDRLHGESVRLTDFHVAPMCTPTRGQLLTGVDALRNAAASVTAGRAFLRPGIPTLPEVLAKAGYRTGIFGKWHLGDSYPHRPMDKGFQTAVWMKGWGFTSAPELTNSLMNGRCLRNDKEANFPGYVTDFCFDEAMQWMKQGGEKGQPFFCYVPLHAAHSPHQVPEKYSALFPGKKQAGFFGMLANIDENMGRLEKFLSESGLRENTLVIFMADNGGTAGVPIFNAGLRGHKTEYYDGGHRVPCFVRWPAAGWRARDVNVPAQVQDWLPTLTEVCQAKPAQDLAVDGVSLAGLLKEDKAPADRMLVVQFGASPPVPDDPKKWRSCVIWNQWRLVHGTELYDVSADRAQEKDVAGKHGEVVEKMRAYYETWWGKLEPQLGNFVTLSVGAEQENPVVLTSSDWQDLYVDNARHVANAAGGPRGGFWNLEVERAGDYVITLRRWPFDKEVELGAKVLPASQPLPIRFANLKVGGVEKRAEAEPGAREVVFSLPLKPGKTQLQGWFQDGEGKDLCGAFYVKVARQN